jgi:hypothetical protein
MLTLAAVAKMKPAITAGIMMLAFLLLVFLVIACAFEGLFFAAELNSV